MKQLVVNAAVVASELLRSKDHWGDGSTALFVDRLTGELLVTDFKELGTNWFLLVKFETIEKSNDLLGAGHQSDAVWIVDWLHHNRHNIISNLQDALDINQAFGGERVQANIC